MSIDAFIERKKKAQQAARLAAYGSINAHTPADYSLKESLAAMGRETAKLPKKNKKSNEVEAVIDDGTTGPIFESEVDDDQT